MSKVLAKLLQKQNGAIFGTKCSCKSYYAEKPKDATASHWKDAW